MPTYTRDPAAIRRCHKLAAAGDVINLTAILAKLKVRVKPDERDPVTQDTALHVAARAGSDDGVRVLIAHGAKPNLDPNLKQETPLIAACKGGHAGCVRLLLDHGWDPTFRMEQLDWRPGAYPTGADAEWAGRTCLSWAAGNGHAECCYELVRYRLVAGLSGSLPLYRIEDEDEDGGDGEGGGDGGGGRNAGKDDDAVSVKSSVSMREKFWFIKFHGDEERGIQFKGSAFLAELPEEAAALVA